MQYQTIENQCKWKINTYAVSCWIFSILLLTGCASTTPPTPNNAIQEQMIGKVYNADYCESNGECFKMTLELTEDGAWQGVAVGPSGKRDKFYGKYWFSDDNLCKSDNYREWCRPVTQHHQGDSFFLGNWLITPIKE